MHSRSAPRRRHDGALKAKVLAACDEPGASISAVALAHGLNTNLVRNWRKGRGLKRAGLVKPPSLATTSSDAPSSPVADRQMPLLPSDARFVAISLDPPAPSPARAECTAASNTASASKAEAGAHIHIELRRGPLHVNVRWPTSGATDCVAWLLELTAGHPK